MNGSSKNDNSLVISYLSLRRFVGIVGVTLPFVLAFGNIVFEGWGIKSSISSYYHSAMGDVFVGALCAIGVFLLSYRGYDRIDAIAGDLACVFAVGVALFPTLSDNPAEITPNSQLLSYIHYGFAAGLFIILAFFCLYLFRLKKPSGECTPQKLARNRIYLECGLLIVFCILAIAVVSLLGKDHPIQRFDPVFWLEAVAVCSFGLSWLVKGETIWADS